MVEKKPEMKEKRLNFFKRLQASKRAQVIFFISTMVSMLLIWLIVNGSIHDNPILLDDDFSWVYQFESINKADETVEITGWAFQVDKDAKSNTFEIILSDVNSQQYIFSQMRFCARSDVNKYFLCDLDYTESGFIASVDVKNLKLYENSYEVLIRELGSRYAQKTGVFIVNGEVTYTSPENYTEIDYAGRKIQDIVENGILKVCRPDVGMYVYQYEEDLYWIADEKYQFKEDGTYIQFQTYTTQVEKLPPNRVERNLTFDDIGFYFENKYIENLSDERYKVAKVTLPDSYSLKMLETGYYVNGEWIWMNRFRPEYDFK